ncbi:FAR1-related sequence 5-like protein, partial [Tanacetum coccineum]
MSSAGDSSSIQVEPSTPHLINNVQDAVIGDDQSVSQVGSYQPTPEGSKFWVPDATNKPVEGTVFDILELALKFYKDYAREARNYKLGLNNFIGKRDAQMVVEKLLSRQEFFDNFSVEFKQDKVRKTLVGLFWAGEKAKQYFDVFGNVVSFDATFHSNRYNMILVPFTGIDNHNRCILFGAALLDSEHIKKYRWLLKRFKKIFRKAPKVVVTDQDPAMKVAIEEIFPESRHRLCMWHTMKKLAGK